ncbi:MAG: hypothetical protein C0625_00005, partial [Arcobacter sp.]
EPKVNVDLEVDPGKEVLVGTANTPTVDVEITDGTGTVIYSKTNVPVDGNGEWDLTNDPDFQALTFNDDETYTAKVTGTLGVKIAEDIDADVYNELDTAYTLEIFAVVVDPLTGVKTYVKEIDLDEGETGTYVVLASDGKGNPLPMAEQPGGTISVNTGIDADPLTDNATRVDDYTSSSTITTTVGLEFKIKTVDDTSVENDELFTLELEEDWSRASEFEKIGYVGTVKSTIIDNDDNVKVGDDKVTVSDEGLVNGIKDGYMEAPTYTGADYTDTVDSNTDTGSITITANGTSVHTLEIDLSTLPTDLSSGGKAITWAFDNSTGTENKAIAIGSTADGEAVRVELNSGNTALNTNGTAPASTASYEVSISKPLDHPVNSTEDTFDFEFDVTLSDGVNTPDNGTITVTVEDDMPSAKDTTVTVDLNPAPVNLIFTLDVSGSMGTYNELELAKEAIENLVKTYEDQGSSVLVQINTFDTTATGNGQWMNASELNTFLKGLTPLDWTNYEDALQVTESNFVAPSNNGETYAYFLSDGNPTVEMNDKTTSDLNDVTEGNEQDGIDGWIDNSYLTNWNAFLASNNIDAIAVGIGTNVSDTYLKMVSSNIVNVDDPKDLSAKLLGTVVTKSGSLDFAFGADGAADGTGVKADGDKLAFTWGDADSANNLDEIVAIDKDGNPVAVVWTVSADGTALLGKVGIDTVIKVEAKDISTNPKYSISEFDKTSGIVDIKIPYTVT